MRASQEKTRTPLSAKAPSSSKRALAGAEAAVSGWDKAELQQSRWSWAVVADVGVRAEAGSLRAASQAGRDFGIDSIAAPAARPEAAGGESGAGA